MFMSKLFYNFLILLKTISVLLALSFFSGKITFGYGLGDIAYWITFILLFVILFFISGIFKTNELFLKIISIIWMLVLITFFLMVTFFRGPEFSWNGNILY